MKAMRVLFVLSISSLVLYYSSNRLCPAQAPPANAQVYHIELTSQHDCGLRKCPVDFSDTIFTVTHNGHQYPVSVSKPLQPNQAPVPEAPSHLLVVFSPGVHRPKDAQLVERLKKVLAQGCLVSVNRADGSFTPYSSVDSLASALAASSSLPMTVEQSNLAAKTAYETLERFPGHSLLLIDEGGKHGIPAPDWLNPDAKTRPKTYIVDRGEQGKVYRDVSWGSSPEPSPQGGEYLSTRVRFDQDGVLHEVKLASAIKDALADARFSFDLSFEIPDSQVDPAAPITLTTPNATSGLIVVKSELYAVAEQIVDGRTIDTRTAPPQKLIVREN